MREVPKHTGPPSVDSLLAIAYCEPTPFYQFIKDSEVVDVWTRALDSSHTHGDSTFSGLLVTYSEPDRISRWDIRYDSEPFLNWVSVRAHHTLKSDDGDSVYLLDIALPVGGNGVYDYLNHPRFEEHFATLNGDTTSITSDEYDEDYNYDTMLVKLVQRASDEFATALRFHQQQ
jgi:hypothetical protein